MLNIETVSTFATELALEGRGDKMCAHMCQKAKCYHAKPVADVYNGKKNQKIDV